MYPDWQPRRPVDGARADCSRASGGAPACGQPGCRDRPEAEPRPCGSPALPGRCLQVGFDRQRQQRLVRDRGLRSPTLCRIRLLGVLAGGSWRRTRSLLPCPRRSADPPQAVGQTRAGRGGGHSSPRPPPPQRAAGLRLGLQQFHRGAWSTLRSASVALSRRFRLHRIALALLERGADPADRFLAPLLEPEDLYAQLAMTEVAPARHAKAAERPHACAPPSIAGQVPDGHLPAKPGLGKTWTSQARPHLPQAHQQQLSSQK